MVVLFKNSFQKRLWTEYAVIMLNRWYHDASGELALRKSGETQ